MKSLLDVINENIWKDSMPKMTDWETTDFDKRNWTYRYIAVTYPRLNKKTAGNYSDEVLKVVSELGIYIEKVIEKNGDFRDLKDDLLAYGPTYNEFDEDENSPKVSKYYSWKPNREEEEKPGLNSYEGLFHTASRLLPQYAKKKYKGMITVEYTEDSVTVHIAKEKGAVPEAFVTLERGFYTDEMRRKGINLPNPQV